MKKHTYHISIYSYIGTCVSWSDGELKTYTTKQEARRAMNRRAREERKQQSLWVSSIRKVTVSYEDENDTTIEEKIAFERK
jgi:hypothetical protein